MKWTTKAALQRLLARLPGGQPLYMLGQLAVGGLRHFTIDRKVQQGLNLLATFERAGQTVAGKTVVELGTGWAPVVPLLFWLYGQQRCTTFDVRRLLRPSLVVRTAGQLATMAGDGDSLLARSSAGPPVAGRVASLQQLVAENSQAAGILRTGRIRYRAPGDTAATGLPDQAVDLIYSNTVLEHVPVDEIERLLRESRRLLVPGGHLLHQIDPSDHFSHGDPQISAIHFLKFSPEAFRRYNSTFMYQNRLRAPDYWRLFEAAGFDIILWETDLNEKALACLPGLRIDGHFAGYAAEELCVTGIRLVARRRAQGGL